MTRIQDPEAVQLAKALAKTVDEMIGPRDHKMVAANYINRTTIGKLVSGKGIIPNVDTMVRMSHALCGIGYSIEPWQLLIPSIWQLSDEDRIKLNEFVLAFVAGDPDVRVVVEEVAKSVRRMREALGDHAGRDGA
jgi:hypothetical protein